MGLSRKQSKNWQTYTFSKRLLMLCRWYFIAGLTLFLYKFILALLTTTSFFQPSAYQALCSFATHTNTHTLHRCGVIFTLMTRNWKKQSKTKWLERHTHRERKRVVCMILCYVARIVVKRNGSTFCCFEWFFLLESMYMYLYMKATMYRITVLPLTMYFEIAIPGIFFNRLKDFHTKINVSLFYFSFL